MVTFRTGKAVIVTKLVLIKTERAKTDHHRGHHLHYHNQDDNGKRFINRRAELLQYSRRLREAASKLPITLTPPRTSSKHRRLKAQVVNAQSCLANCNTSIPKLFKILCLQAKKCNAAIGFKIKVVTKRLQARKRRGFFSKLLLKSRKHR